MNTTLRPFLLLALLLSTSVVLAQTRFGAKVGVNYLIGSQKIQPEPKDPPTNPKGLGMMFGGYMELDLSDQFGIRPELGFSFRRMKTEFVSKESYSADDNATLNGQPFVGTAETKVDIDQRLSYFQVNAPLVFKPSDGFRVMLGPSIGFLMGGKRNEDVTTTIQGTVNQNQSVNVDDFTTTEKKGSSAIRDFRKAEIAAMAGVGYTLPVGLDLDLRFYRSMVTTYDESEGSSRYRIWTNLVEFALGYTFGS